ncbi:MAG: hypothetical protein K6B43_03490 [Treponema sp.]|nr:hypothetical protein [Treponema sp.]
MKLVSDEQIHLFEQNLQNSLCVFLKPATLGDDGKITINYDNGETWVITYDDSEIQLVKTVTENGSTTTTTYKGSLSGGELVNTADETDKLTIAKEESSSGTNENGTGENGEKENR